MGVVALGKNLGIIFWYLDLIEHSDISRVKLKGPILRITFKASTSSTANRGLGVRESEFGFALFNTSFYSIQISALVLSIS